MEKIFYLGSSPYIVENSYLLHELEEEEIVSAYRDIRKALQDDGWKCVINKRKRDYLEQNLEGEEFLPLDFGYKEKEWKNPVRLQSILKFQKRNKNIMISTGYVYDNICDFSGYGYTPFDDITQYVKTYDYAIVLKSDDDEILKKIGDSIENYTIPCENEQNFKKLSKGIIKAVNNYLSENVKTIIIDEKPKSQKQMTK